MQVPPKLWRYLHLSALLKIYLYSIQPANIRLNRFVIINQFFGCDTDLCGVKRLFCCNQGLCKDGNFDLSLKMI